MVCEAFIRCVVHERVAIKFANPVLCANPEESFGILKNRIDGRLQQPVVDGVGVKRKNLNSSRCEKTAKKEAEETADSGSKIQENQGEIAHLVKKQTDSIYDAG